MGYCPIHRGIYRSFTPWLNIKQNIIQGAACAALFAANPTKRAIKRQKSKEKGEKVAKSPKNDEKAVKKVEKR